MDDTKRAYGHEHGNIVCKICGKKIRGSRGMKAHMRWHVENGDARLEQRERVVTDRFAVFPNGMRAEI